MKFNKFFTKVISMLLIFTILTANILPPLQTYTFAEDIQSVDEDEEAGLWERMLSTIVVLTSLGTYGLTVLTAGQAITLETLFFDNYDVTNLNFFNNMDNANSYIDYTMKSRINEVFNFFTRLALIAYMVILVYVGIRVLLNAGTEKNAKYKDFCVYWVQGIAILFLFPFVIKYTIVLNSTFVHFIDNNQSNIFPSSDDNNWAKAPDVTVARKFIK